MPLLRRKARDEDMPKAGPYAAGWDVPARFNFTRDVVEAIATDPLRSAMTFVDREGIVDRRTFHEIAGDAARWAHLMRTRLDRGDRVVFAIGNVPAWHTAMLGAIKSGLVAVPCPRDLRARDLAFRVRDSGARLVVADRSLELEIEEMRHQVGASVSVVFLDEALDELRRYMPVAPTEDTTAGLAPRVCTHASDVVIAWHDRPSGEGRRVWASTSVGGFAMTKAEFVATLEYSLDQRLAGNRSPFLFGAHTDYYVASWNQNAAGTPSETDRRAAIEEFLDYAKTKQEVEITTYKRVLEYVRQHLPSDIVFRQPIPRTIAAADAFAAGQPVVTRSPADAASQAYINVATALVDRIGA